MARQPDGDGDGAEGNESHFAGRSLTAYGGIDPMGIEHVAQTGHLEDFHAAAAGRAMMRTPLDSGGKA